MPPRAGAIGDVTPPPRRAGARWTDPGGSDRHAASGGSAGGDDPAGSRSDPVRL